MQEQGSIVVLLGIGSVDVSSVQCANVSNRRKRVVLKEMLGYHDKVANRYMRIERRALSARAGRPGRQIQDALGQEKRCSMAR
jgi:hypothetical protein